ncbi:MAG: DNA polymerase III subunit delta [Rickettsiales bacterium]
MKIPPKDAERFIAGFPDGEGFGGKIATLLCYGKDVGRIAMLCDKLCAKFLANAPRGEVIKKNFSDFKGDAAGFRDELYAASFFSDRKLLVLRDCPTTLPSDFKEILSQYAGINRIIVVADDLPPASSLRKFAESAPSGIAALPCYADDVGDLAVFVREYMRERGLSIESDAVRAVAESLPGDRMVVMQELEKLALYKGEDGTPVSLKDVENVVDVESSAPLSQLCRAAFSCDAAVANRVFRGLCADGVHGVGVFRALARHAATLEEIVLRQAQGMTEDEAVKSQRPPIFFRDVASVRAQLRLWNLSGLTQLRNLLQKTEIRLKSSDVDSDVAAEMGLFLMMRLAARRSR